MIVTLGFKLLFFREGDAPLPNYPIVIITDPWAAATPGELM